MAGVERESVRECERAGSGERGAGSGKGQQIPVFFCLALGEFHFHVILWDNKFMANQIYV